MPSDVFLEFGASSQATVLLHHMSIVALRENESRYVVAVWCIQIPGAKPPTILPHSKAPRELESGDMRPPFCAGGRVWCRRKRSAPRGSCSCPGGRRSGRGIWPGSAACPAPSSPGRSPKGHTRWTWPHGSHPCNTGKKRLDEFACNKSVLSWIHKRPALHSLCCQTEVKASEACLLELTGLPTCRILTMSAQQGAQLPISSRDQYGDDTIWYRPHILQ